jgi:hypothetical protein
LREVIFPVLKLKEEKWTLLRVRGGKIDFFGKKKSKGRMEPPTHGPVLSTVYEQR